MIFLRRYKSYIKQYVSYKQFISNKLLPYKININHITIIRIKKSIFGDILIQNQYIDEYFSCGVSYRRNVICSHIKIPIIFELTFNSNKNQCHGNYRYTQERLNLYNMTSNKKTIIYNIRANISKFPLQQIIRKLCSQKFSNINGTCISVYVNNNHKKTIKFAESS